MADFSDWVEAFFRQAKQTGDHSGVEIVRLLDTALNAFRTEPQRSMALLDQASALAVNHPEKCWPLILTFFRVELYNRSLLDFPAAIRVAAEAIVTARKPEYVNCPLRPNLYLSLLVAYSYVDPIGYAPQIEEVLVYIEANFQLDVRTQHDVLTQRFLLEFARENYEKARQIALQALALAADDPYLLIDAYVMLCESAHLLHDYQAALQYAQLGEQYTLQTRQDRTGPRIQFLAYQTLYLLKLGDNAGAENLYRQANLEWQNLTAGFYPTFYAAMSSYHEICGDLEPAIAACHQLITSTVTGGMIYMECQARCLLCRLLGKSGQPFDQETETLKLAVQRLIDPTRILSQLDRIFQGDYSDPEF